MTDQTNTSADVARLARFDEALEQIGHRPSGNDRRGAIGGLVLMGVGILVGAIAYSTSTSMSDQRDVLSAGILALIGLGVVVAGATFFLRYSLTGFLRFWMLRLLLEQADERAASKEN